MQAKSKILCLSACIAVLAAVFAAATAATSGETQTGAAAASPAAPVTNIPNVYFTKDISSAGLTAVYDAMKWKPTGKLAIKVSTGESPRSNHLRGELIGELVQSLKGTFVECNTVYGGSRASAARHMQTAKEHGFTAIANVDIQDAEGQHTLPVAGGKHLRENYVGKSFQSYDSYLVLSHFKGHQMAGFGGALKNISIGLASSEGKAWIHSGGKSKTNPWGGAQNAFLESMGDASKSVIESLGSGKRLAYINVMNRLSVDCDCNGNPTKPDMHDIGILASTDPVALDQACVDLVFAAADGKSLTERITSRNGLLTLEHSERLGLGSRKYTLINL